MQKRNGQSVLSPSQHRAALALARSMIPVGKMIRAGDEKTIGRAEAFFNDVSQGNGKYFGRLCEVLDNAAILRTGRRYHRLPAPQQEELIRKWEQDPVMRWPLFFMSSLLKSAHFDDPEIYRDLGCVYHKGGPAEPARWTQQVFRGDQCEDGEEIECDVIVIGTGAGGAVVGKELAERGFAVVFLEEGDLHQRDSFTGSAIDAHEKFYRGNGGITNIGNCIMPIFIGRIVGGSTAVNTATCFRTPTWILDDWCERLGTDEFKAERLLPHFERVERELQVQPNDMKYIGAVGTKIAEGCDKLGWNHFPVPRNAPDCDGQGVCDFGCPSGAKRSTDVSYIPPALTRGAILYAGMSAKRVIIENGRAVGVVAKSTRKGKTLWLRSKAVILAGGTVPSSLFLLEQGICNGSGQVGKNLSLHPASGCSAVFDELMNGFNSIPQGYGCDHFHKEGILLLGAQASINVGSLLFPMSGRRLTDVMDNFAHVASFGAMIEDETQNGRVRRGPGGWPIITYNLTENDLQRLQKGVAAIAEIYFAAGAKKAYPLNHKKPVIESRDDLERFKRMKFKPRDFMASSFHPLGTCRMGKDPRTSVINFDHETHEVPGLFIVDGSTLPGPPAVNPQFTIMSLADRAAGKIAERIS